jgi:hypothetical protein
MGVSTRKVDRLVEALGLAGVSKDQVSRLCGGLQVTALRERPLGSTYPYLWLDAKVEKVRRRPSGAPGPVGRLRRPRHRPPQGHRPGRGRGRDPGAFWREFLRSLVPRRPSCSWWSPTLTKASSRRSPRCSALHGNDARCISCATRSGTAPRTCSSWSARRLLGETVTHLEGRVPKVAWLLLETEPDLLAFYAFPAAHHSKLRSTDESFKAGVALPAGFGVVRLSVGRGRPRSEEQGRGAGSPAAQLCPLRASTSCPSGGGHAPLRLLLGWRLRLPAGHELTVGDLGLLGERPLAPAHLLGAPP